MNRIRQNMLGEAYMHRGSVETEKNLIEGCLEILRKLDCCKVSFTPPESKEFYDGLLRLSRTGEEFNYIVEVKHRPSMSKAGIILYKLRAIESKGRSVLLFTDYIHEQLAEYLRENKVEFVDLAGNVYINRPSLYVFITGRKSVQAPEKPTRAFQATGLKVIFLFLKKLEALSWNYREIEEATGTSLGGIAWVIRDLRKMGFVRIKGRKLRQSQRQLINRHDLFDRWELGYAERLRPSLFYNRYRMAASRSLDDLLINIQDSNKDGQILIGGELGAALLTDGLRPQSATLHFLTEPLKLVTYLKLIPDPVGHIDVLKSFGTFNHFEGKRIKGFTLADPLLIRAELLLRGSDRLRAIADVIYNDFIKERLEIDDQN
jgi:hypothetical protein